MLLPVAVLGGLMVLLLLHLVSVLGSSRCHRLVGRKSPRGDKLHGLTVSTKKC